MESILPGLKSAVNLHPMVVHFPIAFWVAGTMAWTFALWRKNDEVWKFGLWLQTAGALTALVAVALGYLSTSIMGHDSPGHGLVHVHRDIMKVATILSVVLTTLAWWKRAAASTWRIVLVALATIQALVMTVGADRGAVLVYQNGVGVEIVPMEPMEPMDGETMKTPPSDTKTP